MPKETKKNTKSAKKEEDITKIEKESCNNNLSVELVKGIDNIAKKMDNATKVQQEFVNTLEELHP
jgi:hypothetical protein